MATSEKTIFFRPHRRLLTEAMEEVVEVLATKTALMELVREQWKGWATLIDLEINYYCYDERIQWDTWIVVGIFSDLDEKPVVGFTNGNVED